MSEVSELESAIRDIFNIPRRHKEARKDRGLFNQACAALDAIGDTELALSGYADIPYPTEPSAQYVITYGILQAIFIQQDAIRHLSEALGVPFELPNELRRIRDLRNDSVGHPTQRDIDRKKRIYSFHHISRPTLSKRNFQMLSTYSDSTDYRFEEIDIFQIISVQHAFACKLLTKVYTELKEQENSHREEHRGVKLTEIFHTSVPYLFSKVLEGIRDPQLFDFGSRTFDSLVEMFNKFETKLTARGEQEAIKNLKSELKYPIGKVKAYFARTENVDREAAEIYVKYIEEKFSVAKKIAGEIDEDYETAV